MMTLQHLFMQFALWQVPAMTSHKEHITWCSGKPLANWLQLDPKASKAPVSPNQFHSHSIGTSQKSHACCTQGCERKFKKRGNLPVFKADTCHHLASYGMDTITHLPRSQDKTNMASCIASHSHFTIGSSLKQIKDQLAKCDELDKANYAEAITCLLVSLNPDLLEEL
jgi:hypothetical protein